jgi:hypothetical protein
MPSKRGRSPLRKRAARSRSRSRAWGGAIGGADPSVVGNGDFGYEPQQTATRRASTVRPVANSILNTALPPARRQASTHQTVASSLLHGLPKPNTNTPGYSNDFHSYKSPNAVTPRPAPPATPGANASPRNKMSALQSVHASMDPIERYVLENDPKKKKHVVSQNHTHVEKDLEKEYAPNVDPVPSNKFSRRLSIALTAKNKLPADVSLNPYGEVQPTPVMLDAPVNAVEVAKVNSPSAKNVKSPSANKVKSSPSATNKSANPVPKRRANTIKASQSGNDDLPKLHKLTTEDGKFQTVLDMISRYVEVTIDDPIGRCNEYIYDLNHLLADETSQGRTLSFGWSDFETWLQKADDFVKTNGMKYSNVEREVTNKLSIVSKIVDKGCNDIVQVDAQVVDYNELFKLTPKYSKSCLKEMCESAQKLLPWEMTKDSPYYDVNQSIMTINSTLMKDQIVPVIIGRTYNLNIEWNTLLSRIQKLEKYISKNTPPTEDYAPLRKFREEVEKVTKLISDEDRSIKLSKPRKEPPKKKDIATSDMKQRIETLENELRQCREENDARQTTPALRSDSTVAKKLRSVVARQSVTGDERSPETVATAAKTPKPQSAVARQSVKDDVSLATSKQLPLWLPRQQGSMFGNTVLTQQIMNAKKQWTRVPSRRNSQNFTFAPSIIAPAEDLELPPVPMVHDPYAAEFSSTERKPIHLPNRTFPACIRRTVETFSNLIHDHFEHPASIVNSVIASVNRALKVSRSVDKVDWHQVHGTLNNEFVDYVKAKFVLGPGHQQEMLEKEQKEIMKHFKINVDWSPVVSEETPVVSEETPVVSEDVVSEDILVHRFTDSAKQDSVAEDIKNFAEEIIGTRSRSKCSATNIIITDVIESGVTPKLAVFQGNKCADRLGVFSEFVSFKRPDRIPTDVLNDEIIRLNKSMRTNAYFYKTYDWTKLCKLLLNASLYARAYSNCVHGKRVAWNAALTLDEEYDQNEVFKKCIDKLKEVMYVKENLYEGSPCQLEIDDEQAFQGLTKKVGLEYQGQISKIPSSTFQPVTVTPPDPNLKSVADFLSLRFEFDDKKPSPIKFATDYNEIIDRYNDWFSKQKTSANDVLVKIKKNLVELISKSPTVLTEDLKAKYQHNITKWVNTFVQKMESEIMDDLTMDRVEFVKQKVPEIMSTMLTVHHPIEEFDGDKLINEALSNIENKSRVEKLKLPTLPEVFEQLNIWINQTRAQRVVSLVTDKIATLEAKEAAQALAEKVRELDTDVESARKQLVEAGELVAKRKAALKNDERELADLEKKAAAAEAAEDEASNKVVAAEAAADKASNKVVAAEAALKKNTKNDNLKADLKSAEIAASKARALAKNAARNVKYMEEFASRAKKDVERQRDNILTTVADTAELFLKPFADKEARLKELLDKRDKHDKEAKAATRVVKNAAKKEELNSIALLEKVLAACIYYAITKNIVGMTIATKFLIFCLKGYKWLVDNKDGMRFQKFTISK